MATFSTFRNRERAIAAELLNAWADNAWASENDQLGDDATIEFNPNSGYVFLVDDDYTVAMVNEEGKLENWLTCGDCGAEGLRSEVDFAEEGLCRECARKEAEEHQEDRRAS